MIHGSFGSADSRVLNPNGISIGTTVFGGLTTVTDRLTEHATRSLTIRYNVRGTAMRPNNKWCW